MPRASITTLMATDDCTETLYLHQVSGICQSNKTWEYDTSGFYKIYVFSNESPLSNLLS